MESGSQRGEEGDGRLGGKHPSAIIADGLSGMITEQGHDDRAGGHGDRARDDDRAVG